MYDLIIIGSGPSGIYASYLAKLHNLKSLILEASSEHGGQMNLFKDKPIYDLPGFRDIIGSTMIKAFYDQLNFDNIPTIKYNNEVIEVKGELYKFKVITKNNIYETKTVILATGGGLFKAVKLGIPNESKYSNIIYKIDDAKKYIGKKLAIFGGGDSAVDWAHFFNKKGSNVSLIHRREKFRAQEHLLLKLKNKIDIYTSYKLIEIEGKNNIKKIKIKQIKNNDIKSIDCDYLMVFFGQQKNLDKENRYKIDGDSKGYFCNSRMESSRKGIYVIGNVANYLGKINMMITGLGEAATAIGSVVENVYPGKKMTYFTK